MSRSEILPEVTISSGEDEKDDDNYISLSIDYYRSLLQSKRELKLLKAGLALEQEREREQQRQVYLRFKRAEPETPAETVNVQIGMAELVRDYPELVQYSTSLTLGQMMDKFPSLFEHEYVKERDCD